jgi:DNA-binding transcriptional LysR family regulator
VDLDLAQIRAFVTTADEAHFGRAAERLFLTQQAVSKRVAALERALGVRLFRRDRQAVELTEAGERLLAPARQLLAAGEVAAAAARGEQRPLRIATWGHLYGPVRTLRQVLAVDPGVPVEPGPGRNLTAVLSALHRGDLDAGFGRVHPMDGPQHRDIHRQIVRLEPVDAIVGAAHAACSELRPAHLQDSILWCPTTLDRLDFLRHFADRFGMVTESSPVNLGLDHFLDPVRSNKRYFALLPSGVALPPDLNMRRVPLVEPTPLYAWSLVWKERTAVLDRLLRGFAGLGSRHRWLAYCPERHWLPDADHAALRTSG